MSASKPAATGAKSDNTTSANRPPSVPATAKLGYIPYKGVKTKVFRDGNRAWDTGGNELK